TIAGPRETLTVPPRSPRRAPPEGKSRQPEHAEAGKKPDRRPCQPVRRQRHGWFEVPHRSLQHRLVGRGDHRQRAKQGRQFAEPFRLMTKTLETRDGAAYGLRSEEHTSELQSRENLVCRLLLEKKN